MSSSALCLRLLPTVSCLFTPLKAVILLATGLSWHGGNADPMSRCPLVHVILLKLSPNLNRLCHSFAQPLPCEDTQIHLLPVRLYYSCHGHANHDVAQTASCSVCLGISSRLNCSSSFQRLQVSQQANICSLWVRILPQGQQEELCGGRIRQCCNPPHTHTHTLSKCTLWWPTRHLHTATVSCRNRPRKATGALFPRTLRISLLSARKGSVSCGGLSVLWLSVLKDSHLRSHPNVMKFNPMGY